MVTRPAASWVNRPKPNPQAKLRLFCFPYAGGGASIFRAWPSELTSQIEVCAIQYPGREARWQEPLITDLETLVSPLYDDLQSELDRPYAFFGYSLGALIGYELARRLAQQRRPGPLHLFVAAHAAPQLPATEPLMSTLPKSEFIQKLVELNGTPSEVLHNAELMDLLYPILHADFTMNETYRYQAGPLLDCDISAFGGLSDHLVKRVELEAWREQTHGKFVVRMLPGDHFFLHGARALFLRAVMQDLVQSLGRREG